MKKSDFQQKSLFFIFLFTFFKTKARKKQVIFNVLISFFAYSSIAPASG